MIKNALLEIMKDDVEEKVSTAEAAKEQETKTRDIRNLMKNLKLTLEQAMDALSIPQNQLYDSIKLCICLSPFL